MQLGFVSAILSDLSLDEVFAFAAGEGFACVELMCWPPGAAERKYAGVTHVDVTDFTAVRADEVRALATKHGVAISALGYYPNPLDPDKAGAAVVCAHLEKVIVAAARLGLSTVNTFIGRDWTRSVDENWPRLLDTWRPLVACAEAHAIRIGIENCPMLFSADEWPGGKNIAVSPAIWRRLFNDLGPAVGLNYDPSHFVLQQMDPLSPLAEFRDRLFHLHAKDVKLDRTALNNVGIFAHPREWHQPRIPGYGEMDWAEFMAAVQAVGYDGPVCIEVEDDTFGRTREGRMRALRVARNILAPYFA